MNETINFPAAVVFILKNMYFNECEFFQENDADGNPMKNEEGKYILPLLCAVYLVGFTFCSCEYMFCVKTVSVINKNKIIVFNG